GDVFAIPNSIVVTIYPEQGRPVTQTRRIASASTNLDRVETLNELSRYVCRHTPEPERVSQRVKQVVSVKEDGWHWSLVANIISTAGFSAFFGGSWRDVLAAGFVGVIVTLLQRLQKVRSTNVLYNVLLSAVTGACAFFLVHFGLADNVDKIIIGGIMLFIPGLEMTNGIRDMMWGDIYAGLSHLCEAIIIAIGAAGAVAILGGVFA
ncbi:MAG: threonine/serine exporter family protein, partial [Eubacteriales bacterium]|nr:threonine/serine exporter family protein [Eubacteriales bacterium]